MTQLTEHFDLAELTVSDTAHAHGISNLPTPEHMPHLIALANALEKVRAIFGRPVVVGSGYRNPTVNHMVGGVSTSAHALGYAADIHVAGYSDMQVAQRIRDEGPAHGLRWDQLIYEGTPIHPRCVHISVDPRFRMQVLSQPGGPGTAVHPGIG